MHKWHHLLRRQERHVQCPGYALLQNNHAMGYWNSLVNFRGKKKKNSKTKPNEMLCLLLRGVMTEQFSSLDPRFPVTKTEVAMGQAHLECYCSGFWGLFQF